MDNKHFYLVYCKKRGLLRPIVTLGPIVETQERAEEIVVEKIKQGWDANWVGLDHESVWIV